VRVRRVKAHSAL